MDKLDHKKTKNLQKMVLDKLTSSLGCESIFVRHEREMKNKFDRYVVCIPWYLYPVKGIVKKIAFQSFKDGFSENSSDTVTIKRPDAYKGKVNE